jgi:hypothetical protein
VTNIRGLAHLLEIVKPPTKHVQRKKFVDGSCGLGKLGSDRSFVPSNRPFAGSPITATTYLRRGGILKRASRMKWSKKSPFGGCETPLYSASA